MKRSLNTVRAEHAIRFGARLSLLLLALLLGTELVPAQAIPLHNLATVNTTGQTPTGVTVQFSASGYHANEGDTAVTVTVHLSAPCSEVVSVNYTTANGTAKAGKHYKKTSGTLTFAPAQTQATFPVTLLTTIPYQQDRTVKLLLHNPTNATLGKRNQVFLTLNATQKSPITVSFTKATMTCDQDVDTIMALVEAPGKLAEKEIEASCTFTPANEKDKSTDYKAGHVEPLLGFASYDDTTKKTSQDAKLKIDWNLATTTEYKIKCVLKAEKNCVLGAIPVLIVTVVPKRPEWKLASLDYRGAGFGGGDNNFIPIYRDQEKQEKFEAPQWTANGKEKGRRNPVCYRRDTKMWLAPTLKVDSTSSRSPIGDIYLRGGNDQGPAAVIAVKKFSMDGTYNTLMTGRIQAASNLPNQIDTIDSYPIEWQTASVATKQNPIAGDWKAAGKSDNKIFVTWDAPVGKDTRVYLTPLAIGCREAKGVTDETKIVEKIWNAFVAPKNGPPKVYYEGTKNTTALNYYRTWKPFGMSEESTAQLLKTGDGDCVSWAKFFIDTGRIQGTEVAQNYKQIVSDTGVEFLVIKEWEGKKDTEGKPSGTKFARQHPTAKTLDYVYLNTSVFPNFAQNNQYKWIQEEVVDNPGFPGQNNNNPQSIFNNHIVAVVQAKTDLIYDPSYGVTYSSEQDFKDKAVAYYGFPGMQGVPGMPGHRHLLRFRPTSGPNLLEFVDVPYN